MIKTNRILLREIVEADLKNVFQGLSDPQVIQHYGVSYQTLEATREQMDWFAAPEQQWFAICSVETGIFWGAGGLNDISKEEHKAEIGLWLLPDYWGNGIMGEAMPLICQYGFDELGLRRIEGFVESDNVNCKRAMAKLDFAYEGTMKDCELKNGVPISLDTYAKAKP